MASKAQIIATIGPSSSDENILQDMMEHQMDVARLNFSWGTLEEHQEYISKIRKVSDEVGRSVPIIQDVPGPRLQEEGGHTIDPNKSVITDHDIKLIEFGIKQNIDYIALSFVGTAQDIKDGRQIIEGLGAQTPIIAKIERKEAIDNFDEILNEADAIMIARGDLGEALPIEEMPFVQADLIARSKVAGKPVIVATQMLLSMTENDEPTRAEVTDVANAILQGADCVMLSEETASGKYPIQAVSTMERIVCKAEQYSHFMDEVRGL